MSFLENLLKIKILVILLPFTLTMSSPYPVRPMRKGEFITEIPEYSEYMRRLAVASSSINPASEQKLIESVLSDSPFPFNIHLCKDLPTGADGIYVNFYCTALLVLWLMVILSLCLYQFRAILGIRRTLEIYSPCIQKQSKEEEGDSPKSGSDNKKKSKKETFELEPYTSSPYVK